MGWMFYVLFKKDVFVAKVSSYKLRDSEIHFAVWFNEERQKWEESNLEYFRPPVEKHR